MKTTQEMIAVMQAYVDGKEIELAPNCYANKTWKDTSNPRWDWYQFDYRVKEEPKQPEYIPFTFEDAVFLIGKSVRRKNNKWVELITYCDKTDTSVCMYQDLLRDYTFLDGSPCGKLKE